MKISELTNKNFLSNAGAAANSYVLINYEDNSTSEPVTYKTSLDTLGKAIAMNLNLMQNNYNSLTGKANINTINASQGAYTNNATGWYKNNGAAILAFDPSTNTVGYYDDYHNTGYQAYEQTTINNKNIVVNTDSGLAVKNGNSFSYINADPHRVSYGPPVYMNTSEGNYDLFYYDAYSDTYVPYQQTTLDAKPLVVYDDTSETIKYYDTTEEEYVTISTGGGGGGVSYASPEDGFVHYDSGTETLMYYNDSSETYMRVPLADPEIRTMTVSENAEIGPVEVYHLVYGDPETSSFPLYAVADPWRIPGDNNGEYSLVVCDNTTGELYKVVAPVDSDPHIEALTT